VSDLEIAVLSGWITGDGEMARGSFSQQLAVSGDANGLAMLVHAAFRDRGAAQVHPAVDQG
jgi:hypothetical protein